MKNTPSQQPVSYILRPPRPGDLGWVSQDASASYTYDGDGNRVLGTVNGETTVYIGNYFEARLPQSTQLALNPSFENGSPAATNWTEEPNAAFPGTSLSRLTTANSGTKAYLINNQAYGLILSDFISASANTQYDLYAYIRGKIDDNESNGGWVVLGRIKRGELST